MSLTVWQIDAAQMTPTYNITVCQGLAKAGCNVRYIGSRYLYAELDYPPEITFDQHYFRGIDGDWLQSAPPLRKVLRGLYYLPGNWALYQKIRRKKPDIVHFQWSRLPRFDLPLIEAIQRLGIPVVHTVHDVTPLFEKGKPHRLYEIYRQCDALIVHSEANKSSLLAEVPDLKPGSVFTLPLAKGPFEAPENASKQIARERLAISQTAFVVLFFGIIKEYKGIDILLETIHLANQETDAITWLVVGQPATPVEQAHTDAIKMLDRTIVIDQYIPVHDVWLYHSAADVAIFPYRHIFQSGALITAMSFGLPVIATDVGSFPETIRDNGIVIPPEDPAALRDAIYQTLHHWDLRAMGEASRRIVATHHEAEPVGLKLLEIYKDMIRNR